MPGTFANYQTFKMAEIADDFIGALYVAACFRVSELRTAFLIHQAAHLCVEMFINTIRANASCKDIRKGVFNILL